MMARLREAWQLIRAAASDFSEDKASQLAASIAYYAIFSIAPLLVIGIAIAGVVYGERAAHGQIVEHLRGFVGESGAQALESMIAAARDKGRTGASIIGVALLLFGASGVFTQLKAALNTVWDVEPQKGAGLIGVVVNRLLALLMVVVIGVMLLALLILSAVMSGISKYADHLLPGPDFLFHLADFVVTAVVAGALFAAIFKFLPDVKISWRDVRFGAITTGILFAVGKIAIAMYLGRGAVASSYGLAGSVIVLLLWTYYSSLILLFGAELTQVYAHRHGSQLVTHNKAARFGRHFKLGASESSSPTAARGLSAASSAEQLDPSWEESEMTRVSDENEYLQNEAELAKAAIQKTLQELTGAAAQTANPAAWTRRYPWPAVGVAAAAGVAVGALLLRLPTRKPKTGWERLLERLHLEQLLANGQAALRQAAEKPQSKGLFGKLASRGMGSLGTAVKNALLQTVIAGISAKTAAATAQQEVQEPDFPAESAYDEEGLV